MLWNTQSSLRKTKTDGTQGNANRYQKPFPKEPLSTSSRKKWPMPSKWFSTIRKRRPAESIKAEIFSVAVLLCYETTSPHSISKAEQLRSATRRQAAQPLQEPFQWKFYSSAPTSRYTGDDSEKYLQTTGHSPVKNQLIHLPPKYFLLTSSIRRAIFFRHANHWHYF